MPRAPDQTARRGRDDDDETVQAGEMRARKGSARGEERRKEFARRSLPSHRAAAVGGQMEPFLGRPGVGAGAGVHDSIWTPQREREREGERERARKRSQEYVDLWLPVKLESTAFA